MKGLYTLDDIRRLHAKRLAIENQLYYTVDGEVYVGTSDRRLRKLPL